MPYEVSLLTPKYSLVLPHLADIEKKFFELVANSKVDEVETLFRESTNFNVNCVNFQGMHALNPAVSNRNDAGRERRRMISAWEWE